MGVITARLRSGHTPVIREKDVAAGADFLKGALLLMDATGKWAECGADPAAIAAVSESGFGVDSTGFVRTGKREFPPGRCQATLVANEQEFHAEYVGTLPAADGGSYGVVRDTDSRWKVDFAETVNTRLKLVGRLTDS